MSSFDIKSLTLMNGANTTLPSTSNVTGLNNFHENNFVNPASSSQQVSPHSSLFVMTPDGVTHIRVDSEQYTPDITLSSYTRGASKTI